VLPMLLYRYKPNKKPASPGSLQRKGKEREKDEDEDEDYNENADSGTHVSGWSPLNTETPRAASSTLLGRSFRNVNDQEMSFLPGQSVGDTLSARPGAMQLENGSGALAMPLSEERAMDASHLQQTPGDTATPAHLASYYISQDWLDDAWLSQLLPAQSQPVAGVNRGENQAGNGGMGGQPDNNNQYDDAGPGGNMFLDSTSAAFTLDPRQVTCAPIVDSRWEAGQMFSLPSGSPAIHDQDVQQPGSSMNPTLGAISSDPLYNQRSFDPLPGPVDVSFLRTARDSQPTTFGPSPIVRLAIDSLILPQLALFFKRIHPMIPVFSPAYVYEKIAIQTHHTDPDFCAMLLALTSLTLIHPLAPEERAGKDGRREHAKMLLAEGCRLRDAWDFGSRSHFTAAMTSYFMFGALFELGQAEAARMRLREALSLGEIMGLHKKEGYDLNDPLEAQRRLRLFWVLTVTERLVG
jgi:hypothetical protein